MAARFAPIRVEQGDDPLHVLGHLPVVLVEAAFLVFHLPAAVVEEGLAVGEPVIVDVAGDNEEFFPFAGADPADNPLQLVAVVVADRTIAFIDEKTGPDIGGRIGGRRLRAVGIVGVQGKSLSVWGCLCVVRYRGWVTAGITGL